MLLVERTRGDFCKAPGMYLINDNCHYLWCCYYYYWTSSQTLTQNTPFIKISTKAVWETLGLGAYVGPRWGPSCLPYSWILDKKRRKVSHFPIVYFVEDLCGLSEKYFGYHVQSSRKLLAMMKISSSQVEQWSRGTKVMETYGSESPPNSMLPALKGASEDYYYSDNSLWGLCHTAPASFEASLNLHLWSLF